MLSKRIIPCLDVKDGRTVKGINFEGLRDAGDPVELAKKYALDGADELVFLDISATLEGRRTMLDLVKEVGKTINIPYCVGGGISSVEQVYTILRSGADKVSLNSAAVRNPQLINDISKEFGSQCLVVAIDAKTIDNEAIVFVSGGKKITELKLIDWAKECQERGAGEILFTSMDHDGTKAGFSVDLLSQMNEALSIPVIASGGGGKEEHFEDVFINGKADAALAASIFHYDEISIPTLKTYLQTQNIPVRL